MQIGKGKQGVILEEYAGTTAVDFGLHFSLPVTIANG